MRPEQLDINKLYNQIGYEFKNESLALKAFTHKSFQKKGSYERLEFLGDRVLGMIVCDMLYHNFPNDNEGDLAKRHTSLVRREFCYKIADSLGLNDFLLLSPNERKNMEKQGSHILADICESLIAAIYIDGGIEAAREFIGNYWLPHIEDMKAPPKDPKSIVQEWTQKRQLPLPNYKTIYQAGPDHQKLFTVELWIHETKYTIGTGKSKKQAEKEAAKKFIEQQEKK